MVSRNCFLNETAADLTLLADCQLDPIMSTAAYQHLACALSGK